MVADSLLPLDTEMSASESTCAVTSYASVEGREKRGVNV